MERMPGTDDRSARCRGPDDPLRTPDGEVTAGDRIAFRIDAGETVGLVGESGSGKSQAVLALMGLLGEKRPSQRQRPLRDKNLLTLSASDMNKIRGVDIAMIFQDPMTALNPYLTIARQMTEVLIEHQEARAPLREEKKRRAARSGRHPGDPPAGSTSTRTSSPAACASG